MKNYLIEACVNSVESALEAQKGGALRVELCDNLMEGGTTPSFGSIKWAREKLSIGLNVIIRPRGGDFCYSDLEYDMMVHDIKVCKETGVDGVVIGILTIDGSVDLERSRYLVELARPMSVTFHRAFDMTADPFMALEDLKRLGVNRVLTSGQRPSAMEGRSLLKELVTAAGDDIIIMPGVGIDAANIRQLADETRAREFHVLAERTVHSQMQYKNPHVFMGSDPDLPEYSRPVTDWQQIRAICDAL